MPDAATPGGGSSAPPADPIDFRVYTGALQTYGHVDVQNGTLTVGEYPFMNELVRMVGQPDLRGRLEQLPRPVVQATGSSTDQDLDGDIMYDSALKDMCATKPNLSIWLNHSYNLPDDLYGSLTRAPWLVHDAKFTDLWIQSDVEVMNPKAVQTYLYSARGRDIGVSGGFMVLESEWIDRSSGRKVDERYLSLDDVSNNGVALGISHVKAVEWSTVGIPSNQRSWVQSALKGLFVRTRNPLLAPLVRAAYPNKWHDVLASVPDAALRKTLEDIPPRRLPGGPTRRILYAPMTAQYSLSDDRGRTRPVSRQEVADALTRSAAQTGVGTFVRKERDGDDPDLVAQEARSAKYHIGVKPGGHISKPGEWADVPDSQWGDPVNYRYPLHDKAHADNAAARWGDADNRSQYSESEQDIIGGRIRRRQSALGESPDAAGEQKEITAVDLTEKAKALKINADGTHAVYTGAHSHNHPNFVADGEPPDGMHEHAHEHNADADHQHPHTKHAPAADTKAVDKAVPTPDNPPATHSPTGPGTILPPPMGDVDEPTSDVTLDEDGNHPPINGSHTHIHINYGRKADGSQHSHLHTHAGDSNHQHEHTVTQLTASATVNTNAAAPLNTALLKTYNDLGAHLGLAPVLTLAIDPATKKCNLVGDDSSAQRVISLVSELDRKIDALSAFGVTSMTADIKELMGILSIPDVYADADGDTSSYTNGVAGMMQTGASPTLTKRGARNNKADLGRMQQMHDHLMALTDGAVCKGYLPGTGDDDNDADDMEQGEGSNADARTALSNGGAGLDKDAAAKITDLTTKTEQVLDGVTQLIDALATQEQIAAKVDQLKATVKGYETQAAAARADLAALKSTPTGWPTDQRGRELPTGGAAGAAAESDPKTRSLADTLALTETFIEDGVTYRKWPRGLTHRGIRPELTAEQVARMSYAAVMNYGSADAAIVPEIVPPTEED